MGGGEDEGFGRIARRGSEIATGDAHSVRVELAGLAPARNYWYRFVAEGALSGAGPARTAPARDDPRRLLLLPLAPQRGARPASRR